MDESLAISWLDENTGQKLLGFVINTAFCPVTGRWNVLVAGEDNKFHSVHAEGLDVSATWAVPIVNFGPDDEEGEIGE